MIVACFLNLALNKALTKRSLIFAGISQKFLINSGED
jgi:hypothetical protein